MATIPERARLLKLVDHHERIVRRCGGKREVEAMELLRGFIKTS
jgi:hypothetical protein